MLDLKTLAVITSLETICCAIIILYLNRRREYPGVRDIGIGMLGSCVAGMLMSMQGSVFNVPYQLRISSFPQPQGRHSDMLYTYGGLISVGLLFHRNKKRLYDARDIYFSDMFFRFHRQFQNIVFQVFA